MELDALHEEVVALGHAVRAEAAAIAAGWPAVPDDRGFALSAANLAHYLALRRRDLRPLQRRLMTVGLSSLGRLESRVLPGLDAVTASLAVLAGKPPRSWPPAAAFFTGEALLAERAREVLGPPVEPHGVAVLVTCPSSAADDPAFMRGLVAANVEAVRINCAHDDAEAWGRMIGHARAAGRKAGRALKVLMDLAGPKIRTGAVRWPDDGKHLRPQVRLALVPPGGLDALPADAPSFAAECLLPEALHLARPGQRVFFDDAKVGAVIEQVMPWGLTLQVERTKAGGVKLRPEKGLSFPDTELTVPPLTPRDLTDLDFVAQHADGVAYSFVQSPQDVALLQDALAQRRPADWQRLSLVLKIETQRALHQLPAMLVQAASRQPTAVMIARGDLAAEIGFGRTAEMQEEILWIGEAAHVPVIWATQVLESLVRTGTPLRGEMTDAAMAARAEGVMLNKGPYVLEAIAELDRLFARMGEHQNKKTPQLRRLASW
ncbi:pyruvate kinase [Rhodovastum atsumiense]|uniref:Pyruvate kinase n=2 Tax=Rhodovastum atsumiense TaxID=504468 RepID=A0A5M6IS66_9PROT|nr:pyruvate kinase [Rhodovastum atsumiense]